MKLDGREDRIRTCDPLVPSQVLYQAELLPDFTAYARGNAATECDFVSPLLKKMACPERFELPTF